MHESAVAGGILTQWLAIVGVISLFYWAWRIIVALRPRTGDQPRPAQRSADPPAPAAPALAGATSPPAPGAAEIAVIAAAIHAALGAHRIVHLEPANAGDSWAGEGRWMQQTSHRPGPA